MSRLLRITLSAALGLGVVAAAIALGDAGVFVSPPETVAEEFARKVVTGRYDVAMADVVREGLPRNKQIDMGWRGAWAPPLKWRPD